MDDTVDVVVVGLGYVGLPLALEATGAGLRVVGFDPDVAKVESLNAGRSHIDDVSDDDVSDALEGGFRATSDPSCLASADVAVICVPTPLRTDGAPDLSPISAAAATVRDHLHGAMLVILESTTYPGTTEEILQPVLEETGLRAGHDFHLAYSPERIDPGNTRFGLRNTPKVIGGVTEGCTEAARRFYSHFIDTVVATKGPREAEMAKLLENTYRHINIALVNEMAVFCNEMGIDLWDAIAAASTKPFGFEAFSPGPGVGGHCIPIDPNYLSYRVKLLGYPFRFVELAQEINARMPAYVVSRIQGLLNEHGKPLKGSTVLLLGVTYKADIADERESPAVPVARRLLDLGADVRFHDPFVEKWPVVGTTLAGESDLDEALRAADVTVVIQAHSAYDFDRIVSLAPLVFDTRGHLDGDHVERL